MRRTWFPLAGVVAFGLLLGSPALAQDKPKEKPAQPKPDTGREVKPEGKKDRAKPADVATAMQADKLELSKAVTAAEEHSKGHAVGAMGDLQDKHAHVTVHCVVGEKCMAVTVDHTGKATTMVEVSAEDEKIHAGKAADVWKAMEKDKMTLAKAIESDAAHHKGATMVIANAKFDKGEAEVYFTCVGADAKVMRSEMGKSGEIRDMKARDGGNKEAKKEEHKGGDKKP